MCAASGRQDRPLSSGPEKAKGSQGNVSHSSALAGFGARGADRVAQMRILRPQLPGPSRADWARQRHQRHAVVCSCCPLLPVAASFDSTM